MADVKECFGQLANMSFRFIDASKTHVLRTDEEKLKECDRCPLFSKCMFLKYNDMFREVLRLLDECGARSDSRPRLK